VGGDNRFLQGANGDLLLPNLFVTRDSTVLAGTKDIPIPELFGLSRRTYRP
jgi:hypothetical protein